MNRLSAFPVLVLALALSACGDAPDPAAEDAGGSALAVALVPVQREVLAYEVVASGQVAAWQEMPLGVEASGLRVSEVRVEVGQTVAAGEVLLILEAMKMETEIRAAQAGTVRGIAVKAGDAVAVGDTLMTLA